MSRSKQLGGFPTSACLVSDRRTRTPCDRQSKTTNAPEAGRLASAFSAAALTAMRHFSSYPMKASSVPPTTKR